MLTGDTGGPTSMTEESDADLLGYMTMRQDDPAGARAAWAELYRRHAPYLHAICLRAFGNLLQGPTAAGDLVAETFRKAYLRAETFAPADTDADPNSGVGAGADAAANADSAPADDADPDRPRRRVRAWLATIARRLALEALRGRSLADQARPLEPWHQRPADPRPADPARDDRIRRVRRALQDLPENQQHVLRVTMQHYDPEQGRGRLPSDVLAELAGQLDTTPANLRQLRRRALARLRQALAEPTRMSPDEPDTDRVATGEPATGSETQSPHQPQAGKRNARRGAKPTLTGRVVRRRGGHNRRKDRP